MDLLIWGVILVVFEMLATTAGSKWFSSQPYSVSLVPAVAAIVYMRWGIYGMFHAGFGGLVFALVSHAGLGGTIVYALGNLLSGVALLLFRIKEKDKVKGSAGLRVVFTLLVAVLMQLGRGLASLVMGGTLSQLLDFVYTDALSGVFAVVIVYVASKMDGVFEDQKAYLFRINRNEEEGEDEHDESASI